MNKNDYNRLDFTKIQYKDRPTPSEVALKDVEPMQWSHDVMSGQKKVIISKAHVEDDTRCAKVEYNLSK